MVFKLRTLAVLLVGTAIALPAAVSAEIMRQWQQRSERAQLDAWLEPREEPIRIGTFQPWVLTLRRIDGSSVHDAGIAVGGGMQGHGHGLPTQPLVTQNLGDGRYLVDGIKLNMAGRWLFAFAIETPTVRDRVIFDIDIDIDTAPLEDPLASLYLDPDTKPPPSPSNRVADSPAAAKLGEKLFFDQRLSADGSLSCASCHQPDRYFIDGLPRGIGVNETGRNTPTIVGAAHLSWFYWDGRRDSLWSQALIPFEAADEMGSSRMAVVRLIGTDPEYRKMYESVFGTYPATVLDEGLPEHAGPLGGTEMRDAWHRIGRRETQFINAVYANLGKAIAAYERTLELPMTRFDHYAAAVLADEPGAGKILSEDERAGLELFLDDERTHCLRCHNGPWFTNNGFHNIGTGTFEGESLDFGRVFGVRSVVIDEFNCVGPYSDAHPDQCMELRFLNRSPHVPLEGAFKVPGLRNVAATAPYMHDGRFETLESVMAFYRDPPEGGRTHELKKLDLSDEEVRQVLAFLGALSVERSSSKE